MAVSWCLWYTWQMSSEGKDVFKYPLVKWRLKSPNVNLYVTPAFWSEVTLTRTQMKAQVYKVSTCWQWGHAALNIQDWHVASAFLTMPLTPSSFQLKMQWARKNDVDSSSSPLPSWQQQPPAPLADSLQICLHIRCYMPYPQTTRISFTSKSSPLWIASS